MEADVKPGMWITQNIISHQGDYNIFHVKEVADREAIFDVMIILHTGFGSSKNHVFGSWKADFNSDRGVYQLPIFVFRKSNFQVMKRPSPPIRRSAIKILFGEK